MDISLSISSSAMSASTLSNNVLIGHSTGLFPSTLYSIHFFTQSSSLFFIKCPYYLSLPLLMAVVIGSTPTNFLNSSLVLLSSWKYHTSIESSISLLFQTLTQHQLARAWSHFHKSCYCWHRWHTLDHSSPTGELWMSEMEKAPWTSTINFWF